MDFDFFKNLSSEKAKKFFDNFLVEAEKGFLKIKPEIEATGIIVNYTTDSLLPVFKWIVSRLKTLPEKEDESLPIWIKETETYKKGLYSFDEVSRILILRFAFYMGECFIKSYKGLKWSIGTAKTMQQNMPVISGFKNKIELAIMVVCKNMFSKAIEDNDIENAETAIRTWSLFTRG